MALVAASDPDRFREEVVAVAQVDPLGHVDEQAAKGAAAPPTELLTRWRTGRERLADALRAAPADVKLPWFGPPMNARSMATARLMETWAHGQDVADALGVRREPTARLRDICHLGVRTRDFAYAINAEDAPSASFHIQLTGPDGDEWVWDDARFLRSDERQRGASKDAGTVTGTAEDFCLVVTQRRDAADTGLVATGEAVHWLEIAQVFAGAPKGARA